MIWMKEQPAVEMWQKKLLDCNLEAVFHVSMVNKKVFFNQNQVFFIPTTNYKQENKFEWFLTSENLVSWLCFRLHVFSSNSRK